MGLDIRIIREQTLMKGDCYDGLAITGNELEIVAREELGSWHGFYLLADWADVCCDGYRGDYSFNLKPDLKDLEKLRDLLTKMLKEKAPLLFPDIKQMNREYYWECVNELKVALDKELFREHARETLGQYSTYYIKGDW